MRKQCLLMAVILTNIAIAYLVVVDWQVLGANYMLWTDLDWSDLLLITCPALILIGNAGVLILLALKHGDDEAHSEDTELQCSPYVGTKYSGL